MIDHASKYLHILRVFIRLFIPNGCPNNSTYKLCPGNDLELDLNHYDFRWEKQWREIHCPSGHGGAQTEQDKGYKVKTRLERFIKLAFHLSLFSLSLNFSEGWRCDSANLTQLVISRQQSGKTIQSSPSHKSSNIPRWVKTESVLLYKEQTFLWTCTP